MIIAIFIFARSLPQDDAWRRYRPYSLVTGVAVFGLLVLSVISNPREELITALQPWTGLLQRLFVGVWLLWMEIMAINLFRLAARPSP